MNTRRANIAIAEDELRARLVHAVTNSSTPNGLFVAVRPFQEVSARDWTDATRSLLNETHDNNDAAAQDLLRQFDKSAIRHLAVASVISSTEHAAWGHPPFLNFEDYIKLLKQDREHIESFACFGLRVGLGKLATFAGNALSCRQRYDRLARFMAISILGHVQFKHENEKAIPLDPTAILHATANVDKMRPIRIVE